MLDDNSSKERESLYHTCQYRVIYGDTDKAGVVYHANYLRLFEMGRTEYMRASLGLSYAELEREGIVMPVTELFIRYKAPAHYDDLLTIVTSIGDMQRFSISFNYEIHRAEDARLLVKGMTKHAAIDIDGRLRPVPEAVATGLMHLKNSH
ncbi:MAG: thioesterase family protein [Dissulfuribacterales bacterium]